MRLLWKKASRENHSKLDFALKNETSKVLIQLNYVKSLIIILLVFLLHNFKRTPVWELTVGMGWDGQRRKNGGKLGQL